ncbi:MAG: LysM peptidoglycan-binding domain-containing protein [Actinomycetota bacterium]
MRRVLIALTLLGALLGLGSRAVVAVQQRPSEPVWSHVVQPGETLWQLAGSASPDRDPREVVDRLIEANHLEGGVIIPGRRLVLPSS